MGQLLRGPRKLRSLRTLTKNSINNDDSVYSKILKGMWVGLKKLKSYYTLARRIVSKHFKVESKIC